MPKKKPQPYARGNKSVGQFVGNRLKESHESSNLGGILEQLPRKRSKILDVGCCEGVMANAAKKSGHISYACDAVSRFSFSEIPFVRADAMDLPYKNNEFDVVVMSQVLEHLENPYKAMEEAHRVLRKGGTFIAGLPNVGNIFSRLHFLLTGIHLYHREEDYKNIRHITILPENTLKRFAGEIGFKNPKTSPVKSVVPLLHVGLPQKMLFSRIYIFKATKA